MIGSPGVVVDPYDDGFASLRGMFDGQEMPEFIKEATIMETGDLRLLPDHAFAVVVVGQGKPMRKFACADKAHTAVNVMYLLENADHLPHSAKIKAASNLTRACWHFGLEPPSPLVKMAQGGKPLIKGDGAEMIVPGGSEDALTEKQKRFREGREVHREEQAQSRAKRQASRAGLGPMGGVEKRSETSGTSLMPNTRPGKRVKVASLLESPYVEVDYYEDKVKTASRVDPTTSVLDGQLSLLPFDNVVKARDYFEEEGMSMHPRDRHEFCVKLAARADQIGVPVSDTVRKYGSTTFAPRGAIKVAFECRSQLWSSLDDQIGDSVAMQLLEKRASMGPDVFVEALAELDAQTEVDQYWDNEIPDPWLSVFGFEKVAAWTWQQSGEYLTEGALKRFAAECGDVVRGRFGEEMAKSMAEKPTVIFDSLPLEQKRVIARMAQQQESGL
jgi:hypothetical protein